MKKIRSIIIVVCLLITSLISTTALAELIDNGDGTVTQIRNDGSMLMWLKDANYPMTSGYSSQPNNLIGTFPYPNYDGLLNWQNAIKWANSLEYACYDDWRLPTSYNFNGSGPCRGYNCKDSELGYLYYIEGKSQLQQVFNNLKNSWYITSTPGTPDERGAGDAWGFNFADGSQGELNRILGHAFAWAVRDVQLIEIDNDSDGYTENQGDCDDTDPAINPDMTEVKYNGKDDDCNSATKDDDLDGDGFGIATDCNDSDASINPDMIEIPYNCVDNDCNEATPYDDLDGDGYLLVDDCNDNDGTVYPDAPEIKHDGLDQNCNGYDLSIDIIRADYHPRKDNLKVEATSAINELADLYLEGYGPMEYSNEKWIIIVKDVGGDPLTVTVCGVEGCQSQGTE